MSENRWWTGKWFQVTPQSHWHGDLLIEANREALLAMSDALRVAADRDEVAVTELFPGDGEGYTARIQRKERPDAFSSPVYLCQITPPQEMADEMTKLRTALDAALRDAERYRLVREAGCNVFGDYTDLPIPQNDGSYRMVASPNIRSMETLDQYIDSAISSERGGK